MSIPEGFEDDGTSVKAQVRCLNCGITVTHSVEWGEKAEEHECYSESYEETGGVPASGF